MKRRFFLTAGAIASTGVLANAKSLGQLSHFANYQMLSTAQQKQLTAFESDLTYHLKSNQQSAALAKRCTRINRIVKNEVQGLDYHLTFYNDRNNRIELISKKGQLKTVIG